jgi:hypothetical protein
MLTGHVGDCTSVPAHDSTMMHFLLQDNLVSVARFIADCVNSFKSNAVPS